MPKFFPRLFENPNITIYNGDRVEYAAYNIDNMIAYTYKDSTKKELEIGYGLITHQELKGGRGPCSGRLFKEEKILTFWKFPDNKKDLLTFLEKLEKKTKLNIINDKEWKIEYPINITFEDDIKRNASWGNWSPDKEDVKFISIDEYIKPFIRSEEEMNIRHLIPPGKGKKEVPMGYGSKNPKYHTKRQWQMAAVTDESFSQRLKENNIKNYRMSKLVRESLEPQHFQRGLDPKEAMGIGKYAMIKAWLDEMGIEDYIINNDYTIDVNGHVYLGKKNLDKFPDYIQFGEVKGDFYCNFNNLISLIGSPKYVHESFYCSYNKLTSLQGAPKFVGMYFWCTNNIKDFTKEEIRSVCKVKGGVRV